MSTQRQHADAGARRRIVRTDPLILVALVATGAAVVVWAAVTVPTRSGPSVVIGPAVAVVIAGIAVALAVRERIEVEGEAARIVHVVGADVLDRRAVRYVTRAGGRGRPSTIVLLPTGDGGPGAGATGWRAGLARRTGTAAPIPMTMRPRRVADALGVECRVHPRTARGWVRQARDPLDRKPQDVRWDELQAVAEWLTVPGGREVAVGRQASPASIRYGLAIPELGLFWPVFARPLFTREFAIVATPAEVAQHAVDALAEEDRGPER